MSEARQKLTQTRRWVVKVGSSLLTAKGRGLDREAIADWVMQVARLRQQGHEVVLVSSGAVAEGRARLGLLKRPEILHELQAVAAVGQMGLAQAWEAAFQQHGLRTAQVLFTHDDVSHRSRYLNARATLRTLLSWGVVPVVNENDTVATDEIRLGDNDTLGALTSNLIEADTLVILTDQDGLYTADPREQPQAVLIREAELSEPGLVAMAGEGRGELGRGGMRTKLLAAQWAARSGAATVIAHGRIPSVLQRIAGGEDIGTLLKPTGVPMGARKRWIAGQLQVRGKLILDDGAVRVLREQGRSLLPVGVIAAEGRFERGDLVSCCDAAGREVARGLVNYGAADAERILRTPSAALFERLGYLAAPEMIHRDDMVVHPGPADESPESAGAQ